MTPGARPPELSPALADAYLSRPGYADGAIDRLFEITGLQAGMGVLDLGAGAGDEAVERVMRPGPSTFRPYVSIMEMASYSLRATSSRT